jgi:hypothetical protein
MPESLWIFTFWLIPRWMTTLFKKKEKNGSKSEKEIESYKKI